LVATCPPHLLVRFALSIHLHGFVLVCHFTHCRVCHDLLGFFGFVLDDVVVVAYIHLLLKFGIC
jgi:hypothetical protein